MAQIAKAEGQAEIKSSADKFYGFFKNNMSSFVQMFPQILKSFEVVGGGEIRTGSVTKWAFNIGRGVETAKLKIQEADDENTSITFIGLEGDILKDYKSFKEKLQVIRAANGGSIVKWTFECEKADANAPDAKPYVDLSVQVSKAIDAYLCRS
ncbi:hypothetical protein ACLB2K_031488 [Fragaria x ananassa]